MQTDEFESAFGDYLERLEYDEAENFLFTVIRSAFLAGWKAAGGEKPRPQKIFTLCPRDGHKK